MREALFPPAAPVYSMLAREQQAIVDRWAEEMVAESDAELRALGLMSAVSAAIQTWCLPGRSMPLERQRLLASLMITATLEGLGERAIVHPAMAALYGWSAHDDWRAAAQRVLRSRTGREFLDRHSGVSQFVDLMKKLYEVQTNGR